MNNIKHIETTAWFGSVLRHPAKDQLGLFYSSWDPARGTLPQE